MNNLAVASTVFYCVPQYGWIMMLLPLTWGLLRVYFGVHWFSDIVCGFLLGILSFALGHAFPASERDILQGECRDRLLADCHDRAAEDGAKAQSPY